MAGLMEKQRLNQWTCQEKGSEGASYFFSASSTCLQFVKVLKSGKTPGAESWHFEEIALEKAFIFK